MGYPSKTRTIQYIEIERLATTILYRGKLGHCYFQVSYFTKQPKTLVKI